MVQGNRRQHWLPAAGPKPDNRATCVSSSTCHHPHLHCLSLPSQLLLCHTHCIPARLHHVLCSHGSIDCLYSVRRTRQRQLLSCCRCRRLLQEHRGRTQALRHAVLCWCWPCYWARVAASMGCSRLWMYPGHTIISCLHTQVTVCSLQHTEQQASMAAAEGGGQHLWVCACINLLLLLSHMARAQQILCVHVWWGERNS